MTIEIIHPATQRNDDGPVRRSCGCSENNACIIQETNVLTGLPISTWTCHWVKRGDRPICSACLPIRT